MNLYLTEHTETTLRLDSRKGTTPKDLRQGGLIIAVFFLLLGGLPILWFRQTLELQCKRLEPNYPVNCELTCKWLIGQWTWKINPTRAWLGYVAVKDGDGRKTTYRHLFLDTPERTIQLTNFTISHWHVYEYIAYANQINNFIDTSQEEYFFLRIEQGRWTYYVVGLPVILLGAIFVSSTLSLLEVASRLVSLSLDRDTHQTVLIYVHAFGYLSKVYQLSEIKAIQVDEKVDSDGDKTYRSYLCLKSGQKIELDYTFQVKDPVERVDIVNKFLEQSSI